jgi:lysozyme
MWIKSKTCAAIMIAGAAILAYGNAQGQDAGRDEASWNALIDEPSRNVLFQRYADGLAATEGGHPQSFALPSSFKFAHDAQQDEHGDDRKGVIFGIDISHYEGNAFPFADLKRQSVGFVYAKATQGTDFSDKTFDHNWNALAGLPDAQKIPRGAYHFLSSQPSMSGKAQADSFIDYITRHGGFKPGDLRPALDLEWDVACRNCPDRWQTNHRTPEEIIRTTVDFLNEVQARTGRKPLVYTNKSFLKDNHVDSTEFMNRLPAGVKVWIFDVSSADRKLELPDPSANLPYALWQFTFSGKLTNGFPDGEFDVNVFKSNPDTLTQDFQSIFVSDN